MSLVRPRLGRLLLYSRPQRPPHQTHTLPFQKSPRSISTLSFATSSVQTDNMDTCKRFFSKIFDSVEKHLGLPPIGLCLVILPRNRGPNPISNFLCSKNRPSTLYSYFQISQSSMICQKSSASALLGMGFLIRGFVCYGPDQHFQLSCADPG